MAFVPWFYISIGSFLVAGHLVYRILKPYTPKMISHAMLWAFFIAAVAMSGVYAAALFWLGAIGFIVLLFIAARKTPLFSGWRVPEFILALVVAAILSVPLLFAFARIWGLTNARVMPLFDQDTVAALFLEGLLLSLILVYGLFYALPPGRRLPILLKCSAIVPVLAVGAPAAFLLAAGEDALPVAAGDNHPALVKVLIRSGFDPNRGGRHHGPPLVEAALRGHRRVVKVLLEAGTNVHVKNEFGNSALMLAAGQGHAEIVQALLTAGADPNEVKSGGRKWSPVADIRGWTPLMQAAYLGKWNPRNQEVVKTLLALGADVNAVEERGRSALMIAAEQGAGAIARELLNNGADPRLRDREGKSAVTLAEEKGHAEIIRLLKEYTARR